MVAFSKEAKLLLLYSGGSLSPAISSLVIYSSGNTDKNLSYEIAFKGEAAEFNATLLQHFLSSRGFSSTLFKTTFAEDCSFCS